MSVTDGERLVTKQDLSDFYNGILPYMGGMPEVLANKFSKGDLYSTSEKMIGQWIDSKPLYQKVIDCGALPDYTSNVVAHGISNVDIIIVVSAFGINNSGVCMPVPFFMSESAEKNVKALADKTNVTIVSKEVDLTSYSKSYVIIQYTKTTDSAISIGESTDYSTEEKIIGTWIDGKPIFEVVITGLSVSIPASASSWVYTGIGRNIPVDVLIDAKIICDSNGLTVGFDELAFYKGSEDSSHIHGIQLKRNGTSDRTATMAILQYTKTS